MLVQPFLAIQQPGYPFTQRTPNQDCLSRSVTSLFVKELLEYEIPNTAKLPHLKTYDHTTDPDSDIDTYEWTMTSLKLDERSFISVSANWYGAFAIGVVHGNKSIQNSTCLSGDRSDLSRSSTASSTAPGMLPKTSSKLLLMASYPPAISTSSRLRSSVVEPQRRFSAYHYSCSLQIPSPFQRSSP
uniref:Uncharacterized protein n=1 Tax=Lactuca sativa TaxID=4236 RepID=A0A9R1VGL9_LACSA|nr:hypothetical protein LSAT_V11C500281740 [Lactuca sativa]